MTSVVVHGKAWPLGLCMIVGAGCGPGPKPPLHAAAAAGDVKEVARLLKSGSDLEARDDQDLTPLLDAVGARNLPTARLLLEAGADVLAQKKGTGDRALDIASEWQDYAMVRLLLAHGAVEGCREPLTLSNQMPALYWASWLRDRKLAKMLLDAGCQRTARGELEDPPDLSWMSER